MSSFWENLTTYLPGWGISEIFSSEFQSGINGGKPIIKPLADYADLFKNGI
jgi:hypothetical protein